MGRSTPQVSHEFHLPANVDAAPGGPAAAPSGATSQAPAEPVPGDGMVDRDLITGLYQRGLLALVGHAAGGIAVLVLYAPLAPTPALALWGALFWAGWLVRAWAVQRYRHGVPISLTALAHAHRLWERTTLASGVVWGLALAMLFTYGGNLHRLGLALVAVSYCLAAPATSFAVYLFYAAACFLPIVVHLSFSNDVHSEWLAAGVSAIFLAVLLVARQDLRLFQRLQVLKQRDAVLARQLEAERNAAQVARDTAEAANRAKTQFFTAASHDLRQPLHAMALFTRSLQHHPLDPQAMRLVNSIDEAAFAMERLFDQLLDLNRIDSGGVPVRSQAVEMAEIYRRLRVHAEAPAFDKGLALNFRGAAHWVVADPLLLERILRNLVANAIRYTEDGGVLVACRRRGPAMILQVWDTGIGIAPEALPRVFDEFYQLDAARRPETGEYRGMGLGLAIVRRLAGLMHVALSVRTRPGRGTVFTVHLPCPANLPCEAGVSGVPGVPGGSGEAQLSQAALMSGSLATPGQQTGDTPEAALTGLPANVPSDLEGHLTLAGRCVVVLEPDADTAANVTALLRSWAADVLCFADPAALQHAWTSAAPGTGVRRLDLLIVADRLTPTGPAAGIAPDSLVLVRWLREAGGAVVPTIMLVAAGEAGGLLRAEAAQPGESPHVHRLSRPVQPNRLRALVAYKLAPPARPGAGAPN